MKFLCLSDIHLVAKNPRCRKDDLTKKQFEKLDFVFGYAEKNDCIILQAGDFFDKPRSFFVLSEFIKLRRQYESVKLFSVFGQHDMLYRTKENTNAYISGLIGYIDWLDNKTADIGNVAVAGCSWGSDFYKNTKTDVLLIHAPIACKASWPGHDYWDAEKFLVENGYRFVVCGDIHDNKFIIGRDGKRILNTGPMCRISADLAEHAPGFYVWDSETDEVEWIGIPYEKDVFVQVVTKYDRNLFDNFIHEIKSIEFNGIDIDENLETMLKECESGVVDIINKLRAEKGNE
jgi:hypothetical protein